MEAIYVTFKVTKLSYLIISFCGAILHLLLLIGFIKDPQKCFRNSKTYLVANLALADFLVCLLSFCHHILSGEYVLVAYEILLPLTMAVSVLTVALISMDRYLMVAYPIRHRNYVTGKVILLWLLFTWLLAAIYPAKIAISPSLEYDHLVANISGVIITIVTVIACTLTYNNLKKQSLNLRLQNCTTAVNRAQKTRALQEKKFLNTIIIIATIVVFCIWPASIFGQVLIFKGVSEESQTSVQKRLLLVLNSMYYLNFSVNPIIYFLRLPNYRKMFLKVYCRKDIS